MKKIYKLEFSYFHGRRIRYEEGFALGFYESEKAARDCIPFFLRLPGFKEYSAQNFHVTDYLLDQGCPNIFAEDAPISEVFVLFYGYDLKNGYTVGGTLGVFSSRENAMYMQSVYEKWDIFKFNSQKAIGGEFGIDRDRINEKQWTDGFIRV